MDTSHIIFTDMETKKQYTKPEVEVIDLDNEISLVLFSENEPPPDPEDF